MSKFFRVKCRDCSEEKIIFSHSSSTITCDVCSATLATPTGGKAKILAEIIEEIN